MPLEDEKEKEVARGGKMEMREDRRTASQIEGLSAPAPEGRPQHPQHVITTDTVTGVQQEQLVERETNEIVLQMRRMIAAARVRFFREALPLATTEEDLQLARAIAAAIGEISPEEGMAAFRKHLKEQPCP